MVVAICQEMGWTYYEYMSQPSWFLELVKMKLQMDSDRMRKEINELNRKK